MLPLHAEKMVIELFDAAESDFENFNDDEDPNNTTERSEFDDDDKILY
jgi:hypothetical protein